MLLLVLRHGIAIDRDDPDCPPEADRYLTPEGERKTREVARGLRALGVEPDAVLTSPWRRAVQTAEIAAKELGVRRDPVTTEDLLPGADPRQFLAALQESGAGTAIAAGHAPHVDELIGAALGVGPFTSLKKAGVACLEIGKGGATLRWLMEPRQLRALGRA